jgi:hypothetical protein
MVFIPEPTEYTLKFEGTDLEGLEVVMSACSVEEYNMLLRLAGAKMTTDDAAGANEKIVALFLSHLIKWNLGGKDKKPVPRTKEGLLRQENRLMTKMLTAWQVAMVTVDIPLPIKSQNGALSEEQSLGLGNVSKSP